MTAALSSPLRVRFGAPRSNWIALSLATRSLAFDAPVAAGETDPLRDLAAAARVAAEGHPATCLLPGDEGAWALHFEPVDAGVVVDVRPADTADGAAPALVTAGPAPSVLVPFWGALRQLGRRWPGAPCWRHPFPADELARLGAALGQG